MKTKFLFVLAFMYSIWANANGITVSNVSLTNYNEADSSVQILCDVSWQNSWRINTGPSNWDAAWIFAKYRANGGPWRSVTLSASNSVVYGNAYTLDVSNDSRGAFAYRATNSSGTTNISAIRLGWDLSADGITSTSTVEVKVFAIEMVYVPEGAFYVGDGGSDANQFRQGNTANTPYLIDSEDAIIVGTNAGNLYYDASITQAGDQSGPIPANFPKGYNAFYCMKYEISEQQYVEFFNTVDADIQEMVDITAGLKNSDNEVNGNTISWQTGHLATTNVPDRACGYFTNTFFRYYLAWAGLRPMTEFEFEKAARGPGYPVLEGFAWGNTNIIASLQNYSDAGTPTEHVTYNFSNYGRATYNSTAAAYPRPGRCGMYAYNAATGTYPREKAGASFYGIMELSGNVGERVIAVGYSTSRIFSGNYASVSEPVSNYPTIRRGGGFNSDAEELCISYRGINSSLTATGGRGVRGAND